MITHQDLTELEQEISRVSTEITRAKTLLQLHEAELLVLTETRRKLCLQEIGLKPGDYLIVTPEGRKHLYGAIGNNFNLDDIVAIESYSPDDSTGTIIELDRAPSSQSGVPLVAIRDMRQAYLDKHGEIS